MEDIEELKIIISSLRDTFIEYLLPDSLKKISSDLTLPTSKDVPQLLDYMLDENDDCLIQFADILQHDIDNMNSSDLSLFKSPTDDKIIQLRQSISCLFHLVNGDLLFSLSCEDLRCIWDRMLTLGFIFEHENQKHCRGQPNVLDICLELIRSIIHNKPDWPCAFITAVKDRNPEIFNGPSNLKGWKVKENCAKDMQAEVWDIHDAENIPDNVSFVSSLSSNSAFTSGDTSSFHSQSLDNYCTEEKPELVSYMDFFVLPDVDKLRLMSSVSHPEIWKELDSLGILDFTKVIRNDESLYDKNLDLDQVGDTGPDEDLKLRNYQKELSENAVKGKNTIICAPTGSGKTEVAAHILLKHLEKKDTVKPVAFFAPTIPLVKQQYNRLKKYLPKKFKVLLMTGESEHRVSLSMILPGYQVVVMTPKILENHFCRNYLQVTEFSMFLFDECHHSHKREPYSSLMYHYLKAKQLNQSTKLPQIVGLTASISVGTAKVESEAVKSIFGICAQLDAESVSTVVKYIEELRANVHEPIQEMEMLSETSNEDVVKEIIKCMTKLEHKLDHYCNHFDCLKVSINNRPRDKQSCLYGQWTMNVEQKAKFIKTARHIGSLYITNIMTLTDYLIAYNVALEMLSLVHLKEVLNYLDGYLAKYGVSKESTSEKTIYYEDFLKLKDLMKYRKESDSHNLEMLKNVLLTNLVNGDPTSCGIIFVRTRALTDSLTSWINDCEDLCLLNAKPFTGTTPLRSHRGMTQEEQEVIIQQFKKGEVRLLVATSVCDEGLNIPACSLVIIYNHVANEVQSLQRIGRARKKGAKSILLAKESVYNKEKINEDKKKLMLAAIKNISKMNPALFKKKNQILQRKILKDLEMRYFETKPLKDTAFKMICCHCRTVSIDSKDVRVIFKTHRVAVNSNILKHIKVFPSESALKGKDSQKLGDVYCNGVDCINKFGKMMVFFNIPFVVLSASSFVVDEVSSDNETKQLKQDEAYTGTKKWKDFPYTMADLEKADLERYWLGRATETR